METVDRRRQRLRHSRLSSIDLPSGLSADTPHLIGDCIDASMTVTLAAPKLPLVLPPGEAHAGDVVIADIGIPYEVIEGLEGAAHRAADAGAAARAGRAADRRLAQGRLRPRDGGCRLAREDRRGASWPAMGALRSGAGLVTVATPASLPADRRLDGARAHDRAAA